MPENVTGILAILGSILSVVSVLYGIAQALQKADSKYVATLLARIEQDGRRITALEDSLRTASTERDSLTRDLVRVTELLMEAQQQIADMTQIIRGDIAETTSVAKEAVSAADKAYHEANNANEKIADLHQQLNETLQHNTETLDRSDKRQADVESIREKLDDVVPSQERDREENR
jgi:chromosome segregation ATPase